MIGLCLLAFILIAVVDTMGNRTSEQKERD